MQLNFEDKTDDNIYHTLENVVSTLKDQGIEETIILLRAIKVSLPECEEYIEIDGMLFFKIYSS